MRDEGCYHADEIAAEAPQAYNADYYYTQVCNGGHWQFAHNSRMDATTIAHAVDGLTAAGLTELAACLTTLRDRKAGSDDEAAFAALDSRFYAAYGTYHARMNAWLRPKVRVVPDASYAARMEILLRRDAVRERRFLDRQVHRLQALSENEQVTGFALAAHRRDRVLTRIGAGRFVTLLKLRTVEWAVHVAGPDGQEILHGVQTPIATLLRRDPLPQRADDPETYFGLFKSSTVVKGDTVVAATAAAKARRVGATLAFLLERADGFEASAVTAIFVDTAPSKRPDRMAVGVMTGDGALHAMVLSDDGTGALVCMQTNRALVELDGRTLDRMRADHERRHRVH